MHVKGQTEFSTWHSAAEKCLPVPSAILARRHHGGAGRVSEVLCNLQSVYKWEALLQQRAANFSRE